MKNDTRCEDGRLMRHDPQPDDPYLETDIGKCPECDGKGCPKKMTDEEAFEKDWGGDGCENCGAQPTVVATGMCGPCTFGEADTAGGNW